MSRTAIPLPVVFVVAALALGVGVIEHGSREQGQIPHP
jgi:hypothetical protein